MADWLTSNFDVIAAFTFALLAIIGLIEVVAFGFDGRRCGAPNRRRGYCRNPIRADGTCKAGHRRASWVFGRLMTASICFAVAVFLVLSRPLAGLLERAVL